MADDATDTAFGFILFILFLALLGYAAGGVSSSSSTAGTSGGTSRSVTGIEVIQYLHAQAHLDRMETVANVNLQGSTWTPWMPARSARQRLLPRQGR